MPDRENIAIFDFCETLVPFQSASAYVGYVARKHSTLKQRVRWLLFKGMRKIGITRKLESVSHGKVTEKGMSLWVIKGLDYDILDKAARCYYERVLRPALIPEVIRELVERHKAGYRIVVASGGYGIYIRYFAKDFGIAEEDLLSSNLEFVNQKFTGRMKGLDCMGEDKVKLLDSHITRDNSYCVAFSDSKTDISLLSWADEGYVVLRTPMWIHQNKFKVFPWAG